MFLEKGNIILTSKVYTVIS